MASRDLTSSFVRQRSQRSQLRRGVPPPDSAGGANRTKDGLLQDAGAATAWGTSSAQLPPAWVDRVDAVEEVVRNVQLKMRELSGLHTKRLMVTFDDASEAEQEREIEAVTQVRFYWPLLPSHL
jgi:syntaxin 16